VDRTILINGRERPFGETMFWAGLAGVPYLPATAFPIGFSENGLPIGVQAIGPAFADRESIHFAGLLERDYQGFAPPPDYP
jgi:amidase